MAVAVISDDIAYPTRPSCPGLILIYVAIVVALVTSMLQSSPANNIIKRELAHWPQDSEAGVDDRNQSYPNAHEGSDLGLREPLIMKGGDADVEENGLHPSDQEKKSSTVAVLLRLAAVDAPIISVAFAFGSIAALGQALIPYFTGKIVDYASIDPNPDAFKSTIFKLLGVAAGCAIFTGE